jgi:alcohol dehydrogenase (NADP+)
LANPASDSSRGYFTRGITPVTPHPNPTPARMIASRGYAALQARVPLAPFAFERRDVGPHDVQIEIAYCGVCHSDLHQVRDEWGGALFPMVPGHEIVGRVTAVGSDVTTFRVGDLAGVGCMVDACRACASCADGEEQYCTGGTVYTYNSRDKQGALTFGGYANNIVVDAAFVLRVPVSLDLAGVAPLLCADLPVHMGLKFARAFGAQVVQFTTSPSKVADALRLGAHEAVLSNDAVAMKAHARSFDFILDTVSAPHDLTPFLGMLKRDGTMTLVGVPETPPVLRAGVLIGARRSVAGSLIGGIRETQEMLDFCATHGITSDVEIIPMSAIEHSYERMLKGDVKYRFVIDMATLGA